MEHLKVKAYYLRQHTKQLILVRLEISPVHITVVCMLSFRYITCNCNLVTVYYVCLHTCRWCSPAGTHRIWWGQYFIWQL